jgi:2-succinyl-5-enolpyruvyl-6-hydroxy-3-cyclohexene-1-carboxylate synthase
MLPVSRYGKVYKDYFVSSHNLDFGTVIRGFKGKYILIKSWKNLVNSLHTALNDKQLTVLEMKTDIKSSVNLRKKYIKGSSEIISRKIHED